MPVYLLHFDRKLAHAQHYIGFSDDLDTRIEQHRRGRSGARIIAALNEKGIGFVVARIWESGNRDFERRLKKQFKNAPKLCPICSEDKNNGSGN